MAKQRYINTRFWEDDWVSLLDPHEKLIYLYLLTNPSASIAGSYEISVRRIAFDTGLTPTIALDSLSKFEADGKIIYRDGWLLILNFIKHQSNNPKILKGIHASLSASPDWVKDRLSTAIDKLSRATNNLNLNSNSKEEEESPDEASAFDSIWDEFRALLQKQGSTERGARSKIGLLIKKHGTEKVNACYLELRATLPERADAYSYFLKSLEKFVYQDAFAKKLKAAKYEHFQIYGGLEYEVEFKPERHGLDQAEYARHIAAH